MVVKNASYANRGNTESTGNVGVPCPADSSSDALRRAHRQEPSRRRSVCDGTALSKLPSSRDEFEKASGTREFVIVKFLVLGLGPPGFDKVPYNSKSRVYDVCSDRISCFISSQVQACRSTTPVNCWWNSPSSSCALYERVPSGSCVLRTQHRPRPKRCMSLNPLVSQCTVSLSSEEQGSRHHNVSHRMS